MVAVAKAALDLHIPVWFFFGCEQQVWQSAFASKLLNHLHQEIVINRCQKSPGLLHSAILPHQQVLGWLMGRMSMSAWNDEASAICPTKASLTSSPFLGGI